MLKNNKKSLHSMIRSESKTINFIKNSYDYVRQFRS